MGFGLSLVLAGILGKFIGATVGCKTNGYTMKDSVRCGMAMTVRAEVCLVSAQKGIDAGIVDPKIQVFLMVLIMATSFVVPLLLKASYKNEDPQDTPKASPAQAQLVLDRVDVYKATHGVLEDEEDLPDLSSRYGPNDYY
jgi:Kef-type K+ transport system membrane component KefB